MSTFIKRSRLPVSAEQAFRWHARPGAFERLAPPWVRIKVLEHPQNLSNGRAVLSVPVGPFRPRWIAEHQDCIEGRQFRDVQVSGPFAAWAHTHAFEPLGPTECMLEDRIEYTPPGGSLGRWLGGGYIRRQLERLFAYRHTITHNDLRAAGGSTMKILISGSTGLIGSELVPFLTAGGHEVVRLTRKPHGGREREILWSPGEGTLSVADVEGFDAVIHLAGEPIAASRWTRAQKARIYDSRVQSTKLLSETLARLERPPQVLLNASAIGFYGSRGDKELDESSATGTGFLAEVCRDWEAATVPAETKGIRVCRTRFGVILSPKGGALAKMLTPFKLGMGGRLGDGRQFMSWIAIDDVVHALHHLLVNASIAGAVNFVGPAPVTNAEFTKVLGRVLSRPTVVPLPAFGARMAFGEMADELLLTSQRVQPRKLRESGYEFLFPTLEEALRHVLGKTQQPSPSNPEVAGNR